MRQLDDRVPTILERIDLLGEIERRAGPPVRTSGGTATFHCPHPDHPDQRPSFTVKDGRWRCWSACDIGGDAVDLFVWLDELSKAEAIERLAGQVGLARADRPRHKPAKRAPTGAADLLERFLA